MPNNIDPLAYEENLTKAGVPARQAHVHAEAIGKVKNELEELDSKFSLSASEGRVEQGLAELNTKIDRTKAELVARIDATKAELEAKIDATKADLEAKIDETKADLEEKIHRSKVETILWTAGIVISAFGLQSYIIVNMLK